MFCGACPKKIGLFGMMPTAPPSSSMPESSVLALCSRGADDVKRDGAGDEVPKTKLVDDDEIPADGVGGAAEKPNENPADD